MPPPLKAAAEFGVTLRPMNDDDLPFVAELYASTRREELAQTGWPAEVQEAFLRQQHEAQHSHYSLHHADAEWLIVERSGVPIGRLYLREEPQRYHVIDISLLPESRGQGVGGSILRDTIDHASSFGKQVSIRVEKFNPARKLYERHGFRVIEDQGIYDLMMTGWPHGLPN
jgi:ribosomal protein S18 acetylase RimI-like enzyme